MAEPFRYSEPAGTADRLGRALGHTKTRECAIEELLSSAEAGDLETICRLLDGKLLIDVNAGQWSPRRLALGAREHWPRWCAEAGYSALHCAAAAGHAAVCARLLERGARPCSTSRRGGTPLMLACYGGHLETVECLLTAYVEFTAYGRAPTHCLLAELDAMMHGVIADGPGPSALHFACACTNDPERSAAVVAALLRAGATAHPAGVLRTLPPGSSYLPPGDRLARQLTEAPLGLLSPLHLAAAHHNAAAVRHLIAAGAWAQHAGPTGETALGLAQRAGVTTQVRPGASWAGAETLRELRWLPAVRTLWCVVADAEPCTLEPCPLRRLTRDALRLVCAAVVAAHFPEEGGGIVRRSGKTNRAP